MRQPGAQQVVSDLNVQIARRFAARAIKFVFGAQQQLGAAAAAGAPPPLPGQQGQLPAAAGQLPTLGMMPLLPGGQQGMFSRRGGDAVSASSWGQGPRS